MPSLDFKNPRRTDEARRALLAGPGKFIIAIGVLATLALTQLTLSSEDPALTASDDPPPAEYVPIDAPYLPRLPQFDTRSGQIGRGEAFSAQPALR